MKRAVVGLALLVSVGMVAFAAPPKAAASRTLLDSGDLHVSYVVGTAAKNGKPHNTIRFRKGALSDDEYVDGLVTAISAEEHSVGPNNAVFIQAVIVDVYGTHGSVVVVLEETDQFTNLGQWEAPAGGKLTVADAPKDGSLASFAVTPPEPFSTTKPTVPALHVDYDKDNDWYSPDDYATNNDFYAVEGFFTLNQDEVELSEKPNGMPLSELHQDNQFQIIDRTDETETIGDKTEHWYRILLKGSTTSGWVYGGFIETPEQSTETD
jgi:hypothetical protein